MAVLKIWLVALAVLVALLCLQAFLQQQAEHIVRAPAVRRM